MTAIAAHGRKSQQLDAFAIAGLLPCCARWSLNQVGAVTAGIALVSWR